MFCVMLGIASRVLSSSCCSSASFSCSASVSVTVPGSSRAISEDGSHVHGLVQVATCVDTPSIRLVAHALLMHNQKHMQHNNDHGFTGITAHACYKMQSASKPC